MIFDFKIDYIKVIQNLVKINTKVSENVSEEDVDELTYIVAEYYDSSEYWFKENTIEERDFLMGFLKSEKLICCSFQEYKDKYYPDLKEANNYTLEDFIVAFLEGRLKTDPYEYYSALAYSDTDILFSNNRG